MHYHVMMGSQDDGNVVLVLKEVVILSADVKLVHLKINA